MRSEPHFSVGRILVDAVFVDLALVRKERGLSKIGARLFVVHSFAVGTCLGGLIRWCVWKPPPPLLPPSSEGCFTSMT